MAILSNNILNEVRRNEPLKMVNFVTFEPNILKQQ